jgi:hypothetical protein
MEERRASLCGMRAAFLSLTLLCACRAETAGAPANETAAAVSNAVAQPAAKTQPLAKAFSLEEDNDLYGFKYSWSAEAAAVPELEALFRKDMGKLKAELIESARDDRKARAESGSEYHPHSAQRSHETAGQSERLLSLESTFWGFTGGAHGMGTTGSLLWDRALARQIQVSDLLRPGTSWTGAIRQPFCVLLDREREKRRGEPVRRDEMFGECPKYGDVTVLLRDSDDNHRFDRIDVTADQYVAGPYAEGPYEVSLPITAAMIERLKPEYRLSFEPKPPVK